MITKDNNTHDNNSKEQKHRIRIKDFYPNDNSEQEFMEVSDELFFQLQMNQKEDKRYRKWEERHRAGSLHIDDEDFLSYLGKYIETNIDDLETAIFIEQTLDAYGEIVLRRMKLLVAGYTKTDIAKKESVCYTSVSCSIEKAQKALLELLQNSDF